MKCRVKIEDSHVVNLFILFFSKKKKLKMKTQNPKSVDQCTHLEPTKISQFTGEFNL